MTPEFRIEEAITPTNHSVLRLQGRLDARGATVLHARCGEHRGAGRAIVLNLAGVSFIASSGIGTLLALVEEFRQTNSPLRLAALSPAVDSVVRLLQLDAFLPIHATEDEAVAAMDAGDEPMERAS